MGMRDKLYVGRPCKRQLRPGLRRDFVTAKEYLKAIGGVLDKVESLRETGNSSK
jgi:hypothetical protein